jgi:hypothetical protein
LNAATLLDSLTAAGLRLIPNGETLRAEGAPGALTPELRQAIADNKPALLALLGDPETTRDALLELCDAQGIARSLVLGLDRADLAACADLPEPVLAAYVRSLHSSACLAAGKQPPCYTVPAWCAGCGPVWLWEGLPARVVACPWCQRRKASVRLPRPPVSCEGCRHFLPNPLNPEAGIGACGVTGKPAQYPMRSHVCPIFQKKPTANQGDSP